MSSIITLNMPMAVSNHAGGPQAGPSATATAGRGLKGFLTRNRMTSPEPTESTKSRFKSFVNEVSGRGTAKPSTQASRTPIDLPSTKRDRPSARPARPATPDITTKRARNAPHLPPAIQKGMDGRWQQPSLSKGSISTSALARLRDDEDEHTARPAEPKKGKSGLSDLFGAKPEKTLNGRKKSTARPFAHPPPDYLAKKLALDPTFLARVEKEDEEMTIRALKHKAERERAEREKTARQPISPQRASIGDRTTSPSGPSGPTKSRPGSRHTSRVELSPPSRGSKGLPAVPHMSAATSHTHTPSLSTSRVPATRSQQPSDSTSICNHHHLRLAVSLLVKTLIAYVKGPEFSANTKNVEMKRLAEERLAILVRMEKSWSAEWTRIAISTLEQKEEGSTLQGIKTTDIGERTKEKERVQFSDAMRDGVLLCLYFNLLFKTRGQPPPISQINISDDSVHRVANVNRFIAACKLVGLDRDHTFDSSDLLTGETDSVVRVATCIVGLARLAGPAALQRSRSPVPTVRFAGSRPPSRGATPPTSPPQRYRNLSPPDSPTPGTSSRSSTRPTSPLRSTPPTSRAMEKTRSSDSTNDLHLKLVPAVEAPKPTAVGPARQSPRTPTSSTILHTPVTPSIERAGLLPRQSLTRTLTQPNGSPVLRPKSPQSTSTSGSITPTHNRRPSLRPRNTTGSASTSTRVSFAEERPSSLLTDTSSRTNSIVGDMPAQGGLHIKERTPSLVSNTTRPSTAYTRSSAAYSNLTVMDNDDDSAAVVFEDASSSFGRTAIKDRSRRNSEKTLHDARQRIMGTIFDVEGRHPALRETVEPEDLEIAKRAAAISSSLAALEGSPGTRGNARRSPPRPRGPRRGQSLGITGQVTQDRLEEGVSQEMGPPRSSGAASNAKFYMARNSKSPTPLGPSPGSSPTKEDFDVATPIAQPMSRVNSRVSGEFNRPGLRSDRRQSDSNGIYRYGFANSETSVAGQEGLGRTDSRSRLSSIVHSSHSSKWSVDLPARSRPVSIVTLDIPGEHEEIVRSTLSECIGRGQFGSVYKALNNSTGQTVAIKRVSLEGMDEKDAQNVMGEVELLKRLDHPSIVKYMGMNMDSDYLDIILEYVEGGSLGSQLKLCRSFNERLVAILVAKILEGLAYLHKEGVVHRDLKAANILSTKTGNIKLTDFGVSLNTSAVENIPQEVRQASVRHGKVNWDDIAGTPNWMAPEVIEMSGATYKSDIWSLGCTIVELLTGRPPYADLRESMSVMFRIVKDDMPPLPTGLSEDLDAFLRSCFRKEPTDRPSASELFDHPWLRKHCPSLPSLRAQDSIPFLRRVSANFGRPPIDFPVSSQYPGLSRSDSRAVSDVAELERHESNRHRSSMVEPARPSLLDAKSHNLISTTFAKPIICGVCGLQVSQGALCQDCHLICHEACATEDRTHCAQEHWVNYARRLGSSSSSAAVDTSTTSVDITAAVIVTEPTPITKPRHSDSPPIPQRTSSQNHKLRPDSSGDRIRKISNRPKESSIPSKSRSSEKDSRPRQSSQSRRGPAESEQEARARKAEELEKVIMMANAIETIRRKSQAKVVKESKTDCRVM